MNHKRTSFIEISTHPGSTTPFSQLWAAAGPQGLLRFDFGIDEADFIASIQTRWPAARIIQSASPHPALIQALEYLSGGRRAFTLQIDETQFSPFQRAVYQAVQQIPYGQTAGYGQIARQLGRPRAARAVGAANAANPLPVIIPCHRLVGADGSLRGYGGAGGTGTKAWLLDMERHNARNTAARNFPPN